MKLKRLISLLLVAIMLCAFMPNFACAQMTFSIEDIVEAAVNVKNYAYDYSSLPAKIRVGIYNLNMAEFLKLVNEALINIYKDKAENTLTVKNLSLPLDCEDEVRSSFKVYIDVETAQKETKYGEVPEDSYIQMAERIAKHILQKNSVPEYCEYQRNANRITKISFENIVYTWSKVLASYAAKKVLPKYVDVFSWSSISSGAYFPTVPPKAEPTPCIAKENVSANYMLATALRMYQAIMLNKKIPYYVTIGTTRYNTYDYFEAVVALVVNIYNSEATKNILLYSRDAYQKSGEDVKSGSLSMVECAQIGEEILTHYNVSNKAVSYADSSLGKIGFENLVKLYSYVATCVKTEGKLPSTVSITPWEAFSGETLEAPIQTDEIVLPTPTKTPKPTQTPNYENKAIKYLDKNNILDAASRLKKSIDINKELPLYIGIEGNKIMPSQLLVSLAIITLNANSQKYPLYLVEKPEKSAENMADGELNKNEYVSIASIIERFAKYGNIAPSYVMTANGDMSFEALVYMFADIACKLLENGELPNSVNAKSWKAITDKTLRLPSNTNEVTAPPTPTPKPTPKPVPTAESASGIRGDIFATGSVGKNGAVSSASAYASKIGLDILKAGGNAVDAAVAAMFAVGLCEPSGSGIGGGGLAVVYLAEEKRYVVIDYMVEAPKTGGGTSSQAKKACTPGMVHGAITMLEKYGTMTLAQVMNPTIELARTGFIADAEFVYRSTLINRTYKYPTNLFMNNDNGTKLKLGDTFRNEDLANILENIRDGGIEYFYNSEFTDELAEYFTSINGALTKEDFTSYTTLELEPLQTTYRGYKVYAGSGSAQGGSRVVSTLNKLSKTDMSAFDRNSAQAVRATAVAFGMTSRGSLLGVKEDVLNLLNNVVPYDDKTTTMLTTYDKWGNAVAANITLGDNFGCAVSMPGTGFCFNSGMGTSDKDDERVMSTMAPVIVAGKNGLPMIIVGSPGDQAIITATAMTISNIIDYNMNPCEAVNAPRWFGYAGTSSMTIETRFGAQTLNTLRNWGYSLATSEGEYSRGVGCVSAIYVDEKGNITAAADNRREYMSFAY